MIKNFFFVAILSLIFLGCKEDDLVDGEMIMTADFSLSTESYSLLQKLSDSWITSFTFGIVSKDGIGLQIGTHFYDKSTGSITYIDRNQPAKVRVEQALEYLTTMDRTYIQTPYHVIKDNCFSCSLIVYEKGFSITLYKGIREQGGELWTTAYGDQLNSTFVIEKLRVVEIVKPQVLVNTYNIVADVTFACNVYNEAKVMKRLEGKTTIVLYETFDK